MMPFTNHRKLKSNDLVIALVLALVPESEVEPDEIRRLRRSVESSERASEEIAMAGMPPIQDEFVALVLRLKKIFNPLIRSRKHDRS